MTCPRLKQQIRDFRAMYTHLTKRDLRELRRYHSCPECAPRPEQHLSREPEDPV